MPSSSPIPLHCKLLSLANHVMSLVMAVHHGKLPIVLMCKVADSYISSLVHLEILNTSPLSMQSLETLLWTTSKKAGMCTQEECGHTHNITQVLSLVCGGIG